MAVKQIACSVQNDGNVSQLDLQDTAFGGPLMRIETFRCSQPDGTFGVTKAGTHVSRLAGKDHLTPCSNRVFRHIFSIGLPDSPQVTLEFRESFDEDGSCEVRCRDLDPDSRSFGRVVVVTAAPHKGNRYRLQFYVTSAPAVTPAPVSSPLEAAVTELVPGLADLGEAVEQLGEPDRDLACASVDGEIHWPTDGHAAHELVKGLAAVFAQPEMARWAENYRIYERFGDFRDKCVHPGTNLRGRHAKLASEYVLVRAYRTSLILLGPVFDADMSAHAVGKASFVGAAEPLATDPKPGVYSAFLAAYILGIEIYQLGLDKVHSDYGGIPMTRAPGSRLENGATPKVDSMRLNRTLAELAFAFYIKPDLPALRALAVGP